MRSFADLEPEPTAADLRGFRLVVSIGGLTLALFLYFVRHRQGAALALAGGGLALALLSFVPGLGRWLFVGWMGLGLIMGRISSPILLGVVWVVLFVPLGIVFRLVGRDAMRRKFPAPEASFWEPHPPHQKVDRYFQQF
jgi:Saxitoxin biosynthesis operon protein SxtJ